MTPDEFFGYFITAVFTAIFFYSLGRAHGRLQQREEDDYEHRERVDRT